MATSADILAALKEMSMELRMEIREQALSRHQDLQRFMATVDAHFEDLCSQLIRPSGMENQPSHSQFSPWIPPSNLQPLPNLSIPRARSSILLTNPIYPSSPSPPPLSAQKTIDPSSPRTLPLPISPAPANPITTTAAPTPTIISSVPPFSKPPNQFSSLSNSSDPHYPLPAQQTEIAIPPKASPIDPLLPHQLSLTPIVLPPIPSPERFPLSKPLPDPPSPDPPPDEWDQDLTEPRASRETSSNGGGGVKGEVKPGQPPDQKPDPKPNKVMVPSCDSRWSMNLSLCRNPKSHPSSHLIAGKAESAPEREAQFGAQPGRTRQSRAASVISATKKLRADTKIIDQHLVFFFMADESGMAVGPILDGNAVVAFIVRAGCMMVITKEWVHKDIGITFDQVCVPKGHYAGMSQYAGELKIRSHYLVSPPKIQRSIGEYLTYNETLILVCREMIKIGPVNCLWHSNRTGYLFASMEEYVEVLIDFGITLKVKSQMKGVEKVFAEMPHKSFVPFSTMIYGFASNGFYNEYLQLFLDMQRSHIHPDSVIIVVVYIDSAALLTSKTMEFNLGGVGKYGFESKDIEGTALLNAYVRYRNVIDFYTVLAEMNSSNLVSSHGMILAIALYDLFEESLLLFKRKWVIGVIPNLLAKNEINYSYKVNGSTEQCNSVHAYIVGLGAQISMSNADIEMSLCLGNIEIMMCFFSKLNVKIGKNVKSFKIFRFCWDAGGAEEARDVFTEVRLMAVELDNVKVAHVIKACANVSHTSNTFFSGMNVKRFISRILMAMFCLEMGGSAEICELLTEKRAKGVEHDIITLANVSTTGAMAGTLRKGKHVQSQIAFIVKERFIFPALAKALQPIENTEMILLTVKPSYAFGEQGQPTSSCTGAIPSTATLHLVLELVIRKIASEIWNDMKIVKRVFDDDDDGRLWLKKRAGIQEKDLQHSGQLRDPTFLDSRATTNMNSIECAAFLEAYREIEDFVSTWEPLESLYKQQFNPHLEDKVVLKGKGMIRLSCRVGPSSSTQDVKGILTPKCC